MRPVADLINTPSIFSVIVAVLAGGSALQLLLNVVLLIVVGAAGLRTQRVIWQRRSSART